MFSTSNCKGNNKHTDLKFKVYVHRLSLKEIILSTVAASEDRLKEAGGAGSVDKGSMET